MVLVGTILDVDLCGMIDIVSESSVKRFVQDKIVATTSSTGNDDKVKIKHLKIWKVKWDSSVL